MKKKSTSQSAPARRSLGEGGFFNLRVLIGLFVCTVGVLIAFFATASDDSTMTRQELVGLYEAVAPANFVPPACVPGSEMFADVPASNPFCPWIEELVRRGITTGCAPNLYCPGTSVTRAQMAPFLIKTVSPEDVHLVGDPGEPAFENGYTNLNPGSFQEAGFYKDSFGIVHLVGDMIAPVNGVAFTLPEGYRPDRNQRFAVQGNGDANTATVRINQNAGGVQFFSVTAGTTVTLNGITFRTSND